MKRSLIIAIAAFSLLGSAPAVTQTATIELSPQQRTTIKEYVVKEKVKPVTIQGQVRVGAPLPPDVELAAVPPAWGPQFSRYRYVYAGDRVVLVDPSSRQVVQIID